MLTINTQNDKLTAARNNFLSRGMLDGTCLTEALEDLQSATGDTDYASVDNNPDNDSDNGQDLDANEDEDGTGPEPGPPTLGKVTLAQKRGE